MRIIDFRYRPATPESIKTVVDNPVYKNICQRTDFARQKTVSLAEAVAEIRALGVEKAVVTGLLYPAFGVSSTTTGDLFPLCPQRFLYCHERRQVV